MKALRAHPPVGVLAEELHFKSGAVQAVPMLNYRLVSTHFLKQP